MLQIDAIPILYRVTTIQVLDQQDQPLTEPIVRHLIVPFTRYIELQQKNNLEPQVSYSKTVIDAYERFRKELKANTSQEVDVSPALRSWRSFDLAGVTYSKNGISNSNSRTRGLYDLDNQRFVQLPNYTPLKLNSTSFEQLAKDIVDQALVDWPDAGEYRFAILPNACWRYFMSEWTGYDYVVLLSQLPAPIIVPAGIDGFNTNLNSVMELIRQDLTRYSGSTRYYGSHSASIAKRGVTNALQQIMTNTGGVSA